MTTAVAEPVGGPVAPVAPVHPAESSGTLWDPASVRDLILERVIFFSDAVFAIAITLLVVGLRPPDLATSQLDSQLLDQILKNSGQILGFFFGFVVIGLYWVSHLRIFRALEHSDRKLIWLDLAFLFWIVLMPYPTEILGAHDPTRATIVLYAVVQVGTSLTQLALWWYVTRHPELRRASVDPSLGRYVTVQLARTPVVFAFSIPVTLVFGPWIGILSWFLLFVGGSAIDRRFPGQRLRG